MVGLGRISPMYNVGVAPSELSAGGNDSIYGGEPGTTISHWASVVQSQLGTLASWRGYHRLEWLLCGFNFTRCCAFLGRFHCRDWEVR